MNFILVFIGGGIGSLLRFSIGLLMQKTTITLPLATLIANVLACLIFALSVWLFVSKPMFNTFLQPLLLAGFCGGLSTFSSFGFETFLLFKQGCIMYAFINIFINTLLCLLIYIPLNKYV